MHRFLRRTSAKIQPWHVMQAPDSIGTRDDSPDEPAPGASSVHALEPQRVRFVLVEPSHCGNIGAAARAIRTMGFRDLCVVAPREPDYRADDEAVALAVHALAILRASSSHATLVEALDGVNLAFAMTGYARQFGPPHLALPQAAASAAAWVQRKRGPVAFVFGTERTGLQNRDVLRCHYSCAIPADPELGSMNLAQAVQVTAYEMRRALAPADATSAAMGDCPDRASVETIERLFLMMEQALATVGFHDPAQPRQTLTRLRSLLARASLSSSEAELLIGICAAIVQPKAARAGRKSRQSGGSKG